MSDYKVLVVEDSPTMSQLLTFTLKRVKGLAVVTANNGFEGLQKISQDKYDLVLTDINMPLVDGLKFISLVRGDKNSGNKNVPIVIITTEGEDAARKEGMALGANSYITKPINAREVIDTVKKYVPA